MRRKVLAPIDRVCIEIMPINRIFYLTAINSIFYAEVNELTTILWAKDNNCILTGRRWPISLLYHRWNHRRCDGSLVEVSPKEGGAEDGKGGGGENP